MNQIGDIPPMGKSTLKHSDIFKKNAFKEKHMTKINTIPTEQTKNTQQNPHNNRTTNKNTIHGQLQKIYYVVQLHIYLTEFSTFIINYLNTFNYEEN